MANSETIYLSNKWELITNNYTKPIIIPKYYKFILVRGKFTQGQVITWLLPVGLPSTIRSDKGFYYTSNINASGAIVLFVNTNQLEVYTPYYNGAETTFNEILIYGLK